MGPDSANALPSRPRFSWDPRNAPWTDGVGDQEAYANAVKRWCAFHDSLPDSNGNKIMKASRGMILQSQLYGRAKIRGDALNDSVLCSDEGVNAIIDAVYKMDALSVGNAAFSDYVKLLSIRRSPNETYANYEDRFSAALTKLNANGTAVSIPATLAAWSLIHNANIDPSQHLCVMTAAVSSADSSALTRTSGKNAFLSAIKYESVAAVVRQCDNHMSGMTSKSLSGMLAKTNDEPSRRRKYRKKKLSPSELADLKAKSKCNACGKFGHWASEHNTDGSLPPTVKSTDLPAGHNAKLGHGSEKKTIKFNMSNIALDDSRDDETDTTDLSHGALLDDGAPYSAIGYRELQILTSNTFQEWHGRLDPIPSSLAGYSQWQYGSGQHSSAKSTILGSIVLCVQSDGGSQVMIRHLVLEGSSQWIVGRNMTRRSDILHDGQNCIRFTAQDGTYEFVSLIDHDMHSYIPRSAFQTINNPESLLNDSSPVILSSMLAKPIAECSWKEIKHTIDKVHRHVCGHSPYSDIKLLLVRNNFWNDVVERHLNEIVEKCAGCRHTALPKATRKVSLSSLSRSFNELVCIDHFYLANLCLFHIMDTVSRYSSCSLVPSTSLSNAILAFESGWLNQFWPPTAVLGDATFSHDECKQYFSSLDIEFKPIPPRRHSKNVLESKHGVIRSIFLRLTRDNVTAPEMAAMQAVRISNDFYGSDILSAYEMAKGFTRPVTISSQVVEIDPDLIEAQLQLEAKRKLTRILRSKATSETQVSVGDSVEVFIKRDKEKRGKWLTPRSVLTIDRTTGTVTVPGSAGRIISAAFEDVRKALDGDSFASMVQQSIDTLDDAIANALDDYSGKQNFYPVDSEKQTAPTESDTDEDLAPVIPAVGDQIEVFWPLDNQYYNGYITHVDGTNHHITYDDGDKETLDINKETWRFSGNPQASGTISASAAFELKSSVQEDLQSMLEHFGNKVFLAHQAQGFPSHVLRKSYSKEEESFKRTVRVVPRSSVPSDANIISSHVLYKIKIDEDKALKLKARIAPHGNEDSLRHELRSDCSMCAPVGVRILISVASIRRWCISRADVKSAFLQTGSAEREVYVIPPRESDDRFRFLWLLLTASYGLVNANSKYQVQSDNLLLNLGLERLIDVPQLFYRKVDGKISVLVAKIVDDILATGEKDAVERVLSDFNDRFKFGTVVHGPGTLRFFGFNIVQSDEFTCAINADDKLHNIEPAPLTRIRRKAVTDSMNQIERHTFCSINSSLGWLGTTVSPFCSSVSSRLQQRLPDLLVSDLIKQRSNLKELQRLGSTITFGRPSDGKEYSISVLVFADAGKPSESAQLSTLCGVLIGSVQEGSFYHTVSWSSHKSKRPVRSIAAGEILAAGEAIDEGVMLKRTFSLLLDLSVELIVILDSKDLYTSLSTQRQSIDRSVRADVNYIRYQFEVGNANRICWVPGRLNLADPGTKSDSPLTQALQLLLYSGKLPFGFPELEASSSRYKPLG